MWKTHSLRIAVAVLVVLIPLAQVAAQVSDSSVTAQTKEQGSFELLDRGSASTAPAAQPKTHTSPMATLAVGMAGPGVTFMDIGAGTSLMGVGPPAYQGNFYTAPADFPTAWYPFFVTGAFAYGLMLPATTVVPTAMVAAGVAPAPFPLGTMMWAAFATAMSPLPMFMTDMVFGMPGNLPHSPPTIGVTTGFGVACGLHVDPVIGPHLGGITMPVPAMARTLFTFNGPPAGDFLAMGAPSYIEWAAGCFVSGATIPVELQSFSVK